MTQKNVVLNSTINKNAKIVDNEVFGLDFELKPLLGGFGHLIYNACEKHKDKICQVHAESNTEETYASLSKRSVKLAIHLLKLGIKTGDNITCCSPNTLDSAIPITAALYAGAVFSSLDPSLSVNEVNHLLGLIQPKIICIYHECIGIVEEYCKNAPNKPHIIVLGKTTKYESLSTILDTIDDEQCYKFKPIFIDDVNSTCCILFSSGTTGLSKGISLPHITIYAGAQQYVKFSENPTCFFHTSSFYWISAVISYGAQFCNGGCRVNTTFFDYEKLPELIEKYKISNLFLASLFAYKIPHIKTLRNHDLSSIQLMIFGGSTVSSAHMKKVKNLFPEVLIYSGYGMTELGNFATFFHPLDKVLTDEYPNSIGYPAYNTRIKIMDIESGTKLGPNQSGELRIKTPVLMKGYYRQDSSNGFDEDGYIRTGDVGCFDEYGLFYIHDRIKDMFKYQCWHIVPAYIENIINEHPDITGAIVFGFPGAEDELLPAAGVTLLPGSKVTPKDVEEFVAERVLDRQKLRGGVYILDKIPMTPSNKINRRVAREALIKEYKK